MVGSWTGQSLTAGDLLEAVAWNRGEATPEEEEGTGIPGEQAVQMHSWVMSELQRAAEAGCV